MFDVLKEKTGIYSKLGSFYTQVITDKDRVTGHRLSHIPFQTAVFKRFNSMENNLLGYQYSHRKHLNIVYSDKDLKYGTYSRGTKGIPKESEISILPDALQGNADKLTLDANTFLAFVLKVPDDIYVRVIQYEDGSVLVDGVNFKSQYGKIIFTESPISLFKGMTFFVLSYTKRERNIMCYPLQLQDVYGDVSQVVQYYKNNQSLKQFKKALYQAIGIPVVKYKESIIDRIELPHGMSYVMASGIQYDANFPHIYLNIGDTLEKDYLIGGEEFLKVYLPTDTVPSDIKSVSIQNMSIAGDKDLYVNNVEATLYSDNLFQPQNFVHGDGRQYYTDYVNSVGLLEKPVSSIPDRMNCIDFLRNVVAANRCLLIQIDEERIPYDIAMKLKSFIIDHAPIGSVIAYCNGKTPVDPPEPPAPTIVTINGELTKGHTQDSYRGLYHAFAFKISESDGIITWDKEIDSSRDIAIKNIVLTTPNLTNNNTTSPARLALYQADEARFIAVSDSVEWKINTTCAFTFGSDAKVKFTDRLMFVFVHPDTTQEQLLNPIDTGLSVEDDDFTLAAWYIKVMSDGASNPYPYNWGVISSASLNSTERQYMPVFTMQVQQTV